MSALHDEPALTTGSGTSTGEPPALMAPLRAPVARRPSRTGSDPHDEEN